MTEKSKLKGRIRDYNNLNRNDTYDKTTNKRTNMTTKSGTEIRLRYSYKHTDKFISKIQYRDEKNNSQYF